VRESDLKYLISLWPRDIFVRESRRRPINVAWKTKQRATLQTGKEHELMKSRPRAMIFNIRCVFCIIY
jgi:hypothetical protein